MKAIDILISARDRIVNGWRQGGYKSNYPSVCFCAMGALNEAAGKQPSEDPAALLHNKKDPHARACFFLANAVTGEPEPDEFMGVSHVVSFNDHPDTTKKDVIKAYDVAISNCKRRKVTTKPLRTAR